VNAVTIVGGGLIGTSIAWRLAQRNVPAAIIDAADLGGEASTAGAGMLSPGSEALTDSPWLTLGIESLRLYPSFIEELRAETAADVDFRVCGCLVLELGDNLETLHRRAGIRVERQSNGVLYPDDAIVDPAALVFSLRNALQKRGVTPDHKRLKSIETSEHRAVVIAAGAWSSELRITYKGQPVHIPAAEPVKGHLIAFQMQPGLLGPFLRKGHAYVLQRSDGMMIVGSTEEHVGFDTTVNLATCEALHRRAIELVPELAAAEPIRRWIGFRPGPEHADGPILRRVPHTNVWLAYGHYRNGILLTPITAQRIADEIAATV